MFNKTNLNFTIEEKNRIMKKTTLKIGFWVVIVLCIATVNSAKGQNLVGQNNVRTITTAVPFLTIAPDARATGMGDVGVSTSPDVNSAYWNPAKFAFLETDIGASISYTPWLRNLGVNDIFITQLAGYKKLRKEDALAFSMVYFSLGNIVFTDEQGVKVMDFRPNEYAFTASYSRMLSDKLSVGLSARLLHSNLAGNYNNSTDVNTQPATSASVDLATYYTTDVNFTPNPSQLSFGAAITNFGPKISYSDNDDQDFIPTNLRLGVSYKTELDLYNTITFSVEANKLMVPSPSDTGGYLAVKDKGLMDGVFGSFNDAPDGFSEEMQEVMWSIGAEYWYDNLFAVRLGYFHEHQNKGNRKYYTAGAGIRYQKFGLDFSYLIPSEGQNHPLAETVRFTLLFDFSKPPQDTESIVD